MKALLHAFGIGREADPFPPRRPSHRYLIGDYITLSPWKKRFRFGWVLVIVGPYRVTAVGIVGPDWDGGNWLGGQSWKRRGPVAVTRYGRRGSWRGDRRFDRLVREDRP